MPQTSSPSGSNARFVEQAERQLANLSRLCGAASRRLELGLLQPCEGNRSGPCRRLDDVARDVGQLLAMPRSAAV